MRNDGEIMSGNFIETENFSVDVVVPIYNEEDCIPELVKRLTAVMDSVPSVNWNVLLIENGCTDSSSELIKMACDSDLRFRCVHLVRNFGTEGGILAGLSEATGDAVVTMQADLEDPPELIPEMINVWRSGFKYVYGRVRGRDHLPLWRKLLTNVYYRLAGWLSDGSVTPNASDFRLMDKSLYQLVVSIREQNLFLRGLVNWARFPSQGIDFERDARFAGETKFSLRKVILFAFRGILAQSSKPLRLLTLAGLVLSVTSMVGLSALCYRALFLSVPFPGYGTIVGLQVLFFGLTIVFIGLVAEYIALIYNEVRPRPHFIIESTYQGSSSNLD